MVKTVVLVRASIVPMSAEEAPIECRISIDFHESHSRSNSRLPKSRKLPGPLARSATKLSLAMRRSRRIGVSCPCTGSSPTWSGTSPLVAMAPVANR